MKQAELKVIFSIIGSPEVLEQLAPSEHDRRLLLLRLYQGKTLWQISRELNVNYSSLHAEYKRALVRLKLNVTTAFKNFERLDALEKEMNEEKMENKRLKEQLSGSSEKHIITDRESQLLQTSIGDIGLDFRMRDALLQIGIRTVGHMVHRSEEQLKAAPGAGKKAFATLRLFLEENGLALAEN